MKEFKGTINRSGRPKGAQSKINLETRKAFNELTVRYAVLKPTALRDSEFKWQSVKSLR